MFPPGGTWVHLPWECLNSRSIFNQICVPCFGEKPKNSHLFSNHQKVLKIIPCFGVNHGKHPFPFLVTMVTRPSLSTPSPVLSWLLVAYFGGQTGTRDTCGNSPFKNGIAAEKRREKATARSSPFYSSLEGPLGFWKTCSKDSKSVLVNKIEEGKFIKFMIVSAYFQIAAAIFYAMKITIFRTI